MRRVKKKQTRDKHTERGEAANECHMCGVTLLYYKLVLAVQRRRVYVLCLKQGCYMFS